MPDAQSEISKALKKLGLLPPKMKAIRCRAVYRPIFGVCHYLTEQCV